MKKLKLFIFSTISFLVLLIPMNIQALNGFVYFSESIGGSSEYDSLYDYLDYYMSYTILDNITKIEFNDIEKTNNMISEYDYSIDVSKNQDYSVLALINDTTLYIQYSGTLKLNEDSGYLFYDFMRVTEIAGLEYVDTSDVTNMSYMFKKTYALTTIDLSKFDTSNVTNMSYTFSETKVEPSYIQQIDTSNVTDMSYMFYWYRSDGKLDLNNFDTSKVTNMSYMFCDISSTDLDISSWDTSNVTDMSYMFYNTDELNGLDLSNLNTSNVINMSHMFSDIDLPYLDLSSFNTQNVTTMFAMFHSSKLTKLNLSDWNLSKVEDMSYMFNNCYELINLDLSGWDTSNVKNMGSMFANSRASNYDISHFNTSNVTNMSSMFYKTTVPDISHFDTSKVINMSNMFKYANIYSDISQLDTSNVTDMTGMFYNCYDSFLNLTGWDTSNVVSMKEMFAEAQNLKAIYVGDKWNVKNVTDYKNMFYQNYSLKGHTGTPYDVENNVLEYSRIDTPNEPGYFSIYINLTSDDYQITKGDYPSKYQYIYTRNNKLDINKLKITAGELKEENNKLNIYYKDQVIESYDIVTLISEKYQIGEDYIYLKNDRYLYEDTISVINGSIDVPDWQSRLDIYYEVGDIKRIIESLHIMQIYIPDEYIQEKDYIYAPNDHLDISKIYFYDGKITDVNGRLVVSYNDKTIDEYRIFSFKSNTYDLNKEYIYLGNSNLDTSKIETQYAKIKEVNNKLQITLDDEIIKEYDLVSLSSDEYELNGNTIYTKTGEIDKSKIKAINCTIEVEGNILRVKYGDIVLKEMSITTDVNDLTISTKKEINLWDYSIIEVIPYPDNAVLDPNIKLMSSNEHILKVINNNQVFATGIGEAILTVTSSNGKTNSLTIKVNSPYGNDYITKDDIIVITNYDNNFSTFFDRFNKVFNNGVDIQPPIGCNDRICTGLTINMYSSVVPSYKLALRGDLSGDGEIDSLDLASMMNHISEKKVLDGAYREAAYLNNDEEIDSLDLAYLMNHIAGKEGY